MKPNIFFLFSLTLLVCSCSAEKEEKVIVSKLENLSRKAAISRKLNKLELLAQSKEILDYFCPNAGFEPLEDYQYTQERNFGQDKIRQSFIKMKSALDELEIKIIASEVMVDGEQAELVLTVSALGSAPGHDGQFFEHHRGKLELEKTEGKWRICKVEHLENLRE